MMIDRRKVLQGLGAITAFFTFPPAAFANPNGFERAVGIIRGTIERAVSGDAGGDTYDLASLRLVCDHFAGNATTRQLHAVSLYNFDLMLQADARLRALQIKDKDRRAAFAHTAYELR